MNGAAATTERPEVSKIIDFEAARRARASSAATAERLAALPLGLNASTGASTSPIDEEVARQGASTEAELDLTRLVHSIEEQAFEDGVENDLSRGVERLIKRYGTATIDALSRLYFSGVVSPAILSEGLLWLGQIEDDESYESRFCFLVYCLRDDEPAVRSSAALGLAFLEDPRAVPYLRREARVERIDLLRSRLEKVADELSA